MTITKQPDGILSDSAARPAPYRHPTGARPAHYRHRDSIVVPIDDSAARCIRKYHQLFISKTAVKRTTAELSRHPPGYQSTERGLMHSENYLQ